MEYIETITYDFVYDDRETNADSDFSVWRPTTDLDGYFALEMPE